MKNKDTHAHAHAKHAPESATPPPAPEETAPGTTPGGEAGPAPGDAQPAATSGPVTDAVRIQQLEAQVVELRDKWLRTRADMENFRKRMLRETQDGRLAEKIAVVTAFLTVVDHFEMAREHFDKKPDPQVMKDGLDMIHTELRRALESLGVELIQAAGQPFDPNLHQAVTNEDSEAVAAGVVLRQWKSGYRLGERLLRPAAVVVSNGPKSTADAAAPAPTPN